MTTKMTTKKSDLLKLATAYQQTAEDFDIGSQWLKFTDTTGWTLGIDKEPVTTNDLFAVNAISLRRGWIGWDKGEKTYDKLYPVTEELPLKETLPPINGGGDMDGYNVQWALKGTFVGDKLEATLSSWSKGGESMFKKLMRETSKGIIAHPDYPNPVVSWTQKTINLKAYGKRQWPDFEIVDWVDYDMKSLPQDLIG